ncbi:MAG: hypothetical protein JW827_12135 [Spirochaetes bacterium]|nr:hypothetical protein [Spirochaetota bacterium]
MRIKLKTIFIFLFFCADLFASFTLEEFTNLVWHRYPDDTNPSPIMLPTGTGFDSYAVFNCAITIKDGLYYMFYRGEDWDGRWDGGDKGGPSKIGLATNRSLFDGWERYSDQPILDITEWYEHWADHPTCGGLEDPRIFKKDGVWYLTYTGYYGATETCIATSQDLFNWTKHGPFCPQKNAVILPIPVKGKYWAIYGTSDFGYGWCYVYDDLTKKANWHWSSDNAFMTKTYDSSLFDEMMLESSAPPVICEDGIFFLYFGKNMNYVHCNDSGYVKFNDVHACNPHTHFCNPPGGHHPESGGLYGLGWALAPLDDWDQVSWNDGLKGKLLKRARKAFFDPGDTVLWEHSGQVYNAVFGESLLRVIEKTNNKFRERWYFHYGGADTFMGVIWAQTPDTKKILKYHLPLFEPTFTAGFEQDAVYNPSVLEEAGTIEMIYTAREGTIKRLARAHSVDGINFIKDGVVLSPSAPCDFAGVENPGLFKTGSRYYLTYNGEDAGANKYNICLASSPDLNTWTKYQEILKQTNSWCNAKIQNGFIVPQKINGKYVMYFQGESEAWKSKIGMAYCDSEAFTNINNWYEAGSQPILLPRSGYFDSEGLRPAATPVVLSDRILLFYNGWTDNHRIMMGWVAFSLDNPGQVIERCAKQIIMPTEIFEGADEVGTCGFALYTGNTGYIYYGGGKKCVALALVNDIPGAFGSGTILSVPQWVWARAVSSDTLDLKWYDLSNESSYTLFRNTVNDTNTATNIAGLSINQTNYGDTPLAPNTKYYYWLKSYNLSGSSGFSAVISNTTLSPALPPIPQWISSTPVSDSRIDLLWSDISNETSYTLFRSTSADTNTATNKIDIAYNITNYSDSTLKSNTLYYYWLRACNSLGCSGFSSVISNITFTVPGMEIVPKFVAGLKLEKSGNNNIISWSPVTRNRDNSMIAGTGAGQLDFYRICRGESENGPWDESGTTLNLTYQDTVSGNKVYYYKVTAVNKGGHESASRFVLDSSENRNTIMLIDDGTSCSTAKITLAYDQAKMLLGAYNKYKDDLWMHVDKISTGEEDVVAYYNVQILKYSDDTMLSEWEFDGDAQYNFYYKKDPTTGYIENTKMLLLENADQFLKIYRHNGIEWVFQGGTVNKADQCVILTSNKIDRFALMVKRRSDEFTLTQLEPKKIFTPYGEEPHNQMRFYFENPKKETAKCQIFTLQGKKIKELPFKMLGDTDGYFFWDGKDDNNEMCAGGVYIYQLECAGKKINGAVVLVK